MSNLILQNEVKIAYLGVPDDDITVKLISLFEYYSKGNIDLAKLAKKTSVIIAECFQNVIRHSEQETSQKNSPNKDFFQIHIKEDGVTIGAKNLISTENVELLNSKIDIVNSLSKDELRELWIKTIQEGEISEKGGAGIGIIEMARKSGLPLEKKFVEKQNGMSDFFISLKIKNKGIETEFEKVIDTIQTDCNFLIDQNALLHYQGDFSNDTNVFLMEILQANFAQESDDSKLIEKLTLVIEVMENASKHADKVAGKNKGVFSVSEQNGYQKISCSNLIRNDKRKPLESCLNAMKQMNPTELEEEFKSSLKNKLLSEEGNAGIGLLEVAKITGNKFNTSFTELDDTYSVYSIELTF